VDFCTVQYNNKVNKKTERMWYKYKQTYISLPISQGEYINIMYSYTDHFYGIKWI